MSNRASDRERRSRAEARRRARLAARGAEEPAPTVGEEPIPARRGSFLTRLFPPAPPLPDRPPPMSGFGYSGPARSIVALGWLLARAPLVWIGFGLLSGIGLTTAILGGSSAIGLLGTLVQFLSLIAAGWFGWRRPWLYGAASHLVGLGVSTVAINAVATALGIDTTGDLGVTLAGIAVSVLYAGLFGALAGWYGGYLHRRQAAVRVEARRSRDRRR